MSNFQEPNNFPEFETIRNDFGQAMLGSSWLGYADDREQQPLPPYMLDRNAMVCPVGDTCVNIPGTNDMYVRSQSTNKVYFSHIGYERYHNDPDVDKAGVARDLLRILGGSLGGVAPGIVGLLAQALEIGSYTIDCWFNNNC